MNTLICMVKKVVKTTVTTVESSAGKKSKNKKTTSIAKKKSSSTSKKKKSPAKKRKRTSKETTVKSTEVIKIIQNAIDKTSKRDDLIIENFVGLQKAMTNLSMKFSELSQNISSLLGVFESAARTLAESEKQVDRTLTTKLDALIEQNKSLSREITQVDTKLKRGPNPALYSGSQIQTPQQKPQPQAPKPTGAIPPKQLPKM
jgi:ABC-type transporter Mla subunit MlaD